MDTFKFLKVIMVDMLSALMYTCAAQSQAGGHAILADQFSIMAVACMMRQLDLPHECQFRSSGALTYIEFEFAGTTIF